MVLSAAVVRAAACVTTESTVLTLDQLGMMCDTLLEGITYAFRVYNSSFDRFLNPRRDAEAATVGRSTRLLLSNKSFMAFAVTKDRHLRPVLVAGATMHVHARDAYLYVSEESANTAEVSILSQRPCRKCRWVG